MNIKIIAAMDNLRAIGYKNKLLWPSGSQRGDMANFKEKTTGHAVVMGHKTWESLPAKYKPLPDRLNIVLTRTHPTQEMVDKYPNVMWCSSFPSAMRGAEAAGHEELWVCGGGEIYKEAMKYCDELHLTVIHNTSQHSDTKFPNIKNNLTEGVEESLINMSLHKADDHNRYAYTFFTFHCDIIFKDRAPGAIHLTDTELLPDPGDVKYPVIRDTDG